MAPRQPLIARRSGTKAETSAEELSKLIAKETGVLMPPEKLLYLFNLKFHLLSSLAHEIHDGIGADPKLGMRLDKEAQKRHAKS